MTDEKTQSETCAVPPVTRKTLIIEVLESRPLAGKVLREAFGLPCEECVVAETETVEQGARYYGHDADAIVAKLNECPPKPVLSERPEGSRVEGPLSSGEQGASK
jgi:hybrid cluster-associated redox disulfide protein